MQIKQKSCAIRKPPEVLGVRPQLIPVREPHSAQQHAGG